MHSRSPLGVTRPVGPLRFPTGRSVRAAPSHPGGLDRCMCPLLRDRCQASPAWAGWPSPLWFNEAETGSLLAARTFALRGSAPRVAPTHARSATCRTGNLHGKLLSACETYRASPDAPKPTTPEEWSKPRVQHFQADSKGNVSLSAARRTQARKHSGQNLASPGTALAIVIN
jgi:hypothetical protein